jgi:hypothetical protein
LGKVRLNGGGVFESLLRSNLMNSRKAFLTAPQNCTGLVVEARRFNREKRRSRKSVS